MKIAIFGASGFIGTALQGKLCAKGHEIVPFSRSAKPGFAYWDPERKQIDTEALAKCDGVINLAGESVVGRWTQRKRKRIRQSRLQSTRFLAEVFQQTPPKVWINASAIGYYGDRGQEVLTEQSSSGQSFLPEVCHEWEDAALQMQQKTRVVLPRIGLVLGKSGGMLGRMLPAFRLGLGGRIGDGSQIMSWITLEDLTRAFVYLLEHETLNGPFNLVAPKPVSNAVFTRTLGSVLHRPTLVPLPKMLLKLLFGSGAEVFVASQHVKPAKLLEAGFSFSHPTLGSALKSICQEIPADGTD